MGGSYTRQVFIVWNSSLTGHSAFYFLHLFLCTKYANPTRGVWAFGRGRGKEKEERKKKPLPKPWRKREGSSEEVMAERRLGDVREQESMLSRRNISFLESVGGIRPVPPEICQSPVRQEPQMPPGMSGHEPAEVPRGYCTQAIQAHNKNLVHLLKYRFPGPSWVPP